MLRIEASWELPLEEVSALALRRRGRAGPTELVAVDDERYAVATAVIAASGLSRVKAVDVDFQHRPARSGSEFEGVASDGSGRVFVLQEGAAIVLVVNPRLRRVEQTIVLRVPTGDRDLGHDWNDPENLNSRGEGLLLLSGGHILVAKQREPVRLIEFGPPGEAALGFTHGSALKPDDAFEIESLEMTALASWPVEDHGDVKSINDLAVDGDGYLHLVSSKSRSVARLTDGLEPGAGAARVTAHELPDDLFETDEDKAEGLIFTRELGWLVGLDLKRSAPNVFQIRGIPQR